MSMFGRRVFGGSPETFVLSLEFGHSSPAGGEVSSYSQHAVRLPVAVARLDFRWSSDEAEADVIERFAREKSAALLDKVEERVVAAVRSSSIVNAASFPAPRLHLDLAVAAVPPALRSIQFARVGASGTPPDSLLSALLAHCDVSTAWKVKGPEGFSAFWATCVPSVTHWASLRTLNLANGGLAAVPAAIGGIGSLRILRLSHNKLTQLPPELGKLVRLEVLAADNNLLVAVPVDLRHCTALREINLENNKLATPVLHLRDLRQLQSLQLYGNPLEYLPELSHCKHLRSLSLANVRILADLNYSRWEVEVGAASYMSRTTKLGPFFGLIFRRSSVQHPLIAGALGRIAESDRSACDAIAKEDVALQQLMLMALSEEPLVVKQACRLLELLGQDGATAQKLVDHDVMSAIRSLITAKQQELQLCGLRVLSSLAVGVESSMDLLTPQLLQLLQQLVAEGPGDLRCAALEAVGSLAFTADNKQLIARMDGFMQQLLDLAGGLNASGAGPQLRKAAIRLLAVLGHNDAVRVALNQSVSRQRGVRVLAMDGGGMKGLAMVEMLRDIERRAGRPIRGCFDVIGGTSTGAILAVGLGMLNMDLDQCEDVYTSLGQKVFNQAVSPMKEDPTTGWRESLYRMYKSSSTNFRVAVYGYKHDAATFQKLLKDMCNLQKLGCSSDRLIDAACLGGPKVFVVSTLASVTPCAPFLFRNYELPLEAESHAAQIRACRGTSKHMLWQAIRASSAAPYYLEDYVFGEDRFQDGAATANNPALLAVQQARLLFPNDPIACVVSLGCGSNPPARRERSMSSYLDTGSVLIESACSTERVDEALATLMPLVPDTKYYRFSPVDVRCNMGLDEIDPAAWTQLRAAAREYFAQPEVSSQLQELCMQLREGRMVGAAPTADASADLAAGAAAGPPGSSPTTSLESRLGLQKGLLLVEAPRSMLPGCITYVETVAAMAAQLPQLAGRWNTGQGHVIVSDESAADEQASAQHAGFADAADALRSLPSLDAMLQPDSGAQAQVAGDTPDARPAALEAPPDTANPASPMGAWLDMLLPSSWHGGSSKPSGGAGLSAASATAAATGGSPLVAKTSGSTTAAPTLHRASADGTTSPAAVRSPSSTAAPPRTSTGGDPASPHARAALQRAGLSLQLHDKRTHPHPALTSPIRRSTSSGQQHSRTAAAAVAAGISSPGGEAANGGQRTSQSGGPSILLDPAAPGVTAATGAPSPGVSSAGMDAEQQQRPQQQQHERHPPSPHELLLAALQQGGEAGCGVVHLALHGHSQGLVLSWRETIEAVVEPGQDASEWVRTLGGDPTHDTLASLTARTSNFQLPDGTLVTLLSQHSIRAPAGHVIRSFLLQRTQPAAVLTAQQLFGMIAALTGRVVVLSVRPPGQVLAALLKCGARAVVAPVADLASHEPERLDGFFKLLYQHLRSGAPVAAALEQALREHPQLQGLLHCFEHA